MHFSRGLPLAEFTRLVLEDVLRKPFVLSPELLSSTQLVGVSHEKLSVNDAETILSHVLDAQGFQIQKKGQIYYITRKEEIDTAGKIHVTYRPKCRPVSFFASALPAVFPEVLFSFQNNQSKNPGSSELAGLDYFFAYVEPAHRPALDSIFTELDAPVPQVYIRANLLEVQSDNRESTGVQVTASLINDYLKIQTSPVALATSVIFGKTDASITFSPFSGDSRFESLSSPALVVNHAQTAALVGDTQFPLESFSQDGSRLTSKTEYFDIGTNVTVTPQVTGDSVTLDVNLSSSDVSQKSLGSSSAPTISRRSLNTQVTLLSGSTAIIGGLKVNRDLSSSSKPFFFLPPFSSDSTKSMTELVLVLHVEILNQDKACTR